LFKTIIISVTCGCVVAGLQAGALYATQAAANPAGHNLGGPEGSVAIAFFLALALMCAHAPVADDPTQCRRATVMIFATTLLTLGVQHAGWVVEHMMIVKLQGTRQGQALAIYRILGSLALPTATEATDIFQAFQQSTIAGDFATLNLMSARHLVLEDQGFRAPEGARPYDIEAIITSTLCGLGGTRPSGKAPRGAGARALKGKGKGK